jgi:hypothetical protein
LDVRPEGVRVLTVDVEHDDSWLGESHDLLEDRRCEATLPLPSTAENGDMPAQSTSEVEEQGCSGPEVCSNLEARTELADGLPRCPEFVSREWKRLGAERGRNERVRLELQPASSTS